LQDENIELCRFSKDGTKPFLFTTVQKGILKSGFSLFSRVLMPFPSLKADRNDVDDERLLYQSV